MSHVMRDVKPFLFLGTILAAGLFGMLAPSFAQTQTITEGERSTGPLARAVRPATTRAARPAAAVEDETPVDFAALRAQYALPPEQWPAATWDENVALADRRELARVPKVEFPEDNPYSRDKAQLGWQLFFDPRLSGSGQIACVSCHHPDTGWSDSRLNSLGHGLETGPRNAPALMGVVFEKELMWDGRARSLEEQVLMPLGNPQEMHAEFKQIEENLNAVPAYKEEFKRVFGGERATVGKAARAIATFVRTIVPGRSRYDRFLSGRVDALDDAELHGLHLFRTKARCINCHNGPLLNDGKFHNLGLTYYGRKYEDLGRYKVTQDPDDVGAFKTPSLRNLVRTAPYMHNGFFELPGLINLYNIGMPTERREKMPNDPLKPKKSPILQPLELTNREKEDLMAFLNEGLREPRLRVRAPVIPGLYGADPTTMPALPGGASTRAARGPSTAATAQEAEDEANSP